MSISTGELEIRGVTGEYTVRVPTHELPHMREPEISVLGAIDLEGARLAERRCMPDGPEIVCVGKYVFAAPPDKVVVRSRLAETIVATHVHVVQARREGLTGRVVLTQLQPRGELLFEAGVSWRRWLLLALVIAASFFVRRWWLAAAIGAAAGWLIPWRVEPSFVEWSLAIVAAYCLFEAWYVHAGRYRWIAPAALGFTAGLYAPIWLRGA